MRMKTLLLVTVATLGLNSSMMAQNLPNYVPANGLVGWWPFNGNANDESGKGNHGTVNGATLTTDRFGNVGKAYSFDGSKIITQYQGIAGNGSRTISFWCNTDSLLNSNGINDQWCLVGYGGALPCGTFFNCNIKSQSNNDLGMDGGASLYYFNTNSIPSSWHNFVVTYDAIFGINMQSTKVYIDGVFQTMANYTLGSSCNLNTILSYPLTFGANPNPNITINNYVGKLDDIGFWNRALNQQEITDLYNANICYQNITVTDTLIIKTGITAFNPVTYNNTIKIFPNPTNDHITINYGNYATINGYQLKIENSLGQQLFQTNISKQSDYLDLTNWGGNGIYFVRIIDPQGNTIDIKKIVLQ